MNEIKLNKGFLVTLHNDLIQARFSGSLSMMEQKILFTVLSNIEPPEQEVVDGRKVIKKRTEEIKPFILPIKEFTKFLEIEDPNYTYFRTVTSKLMEKVIHIQQDDGSWELFHWVDYAKYQKNEGTIQIKISEHLYPYLLNLEKDFTKTKLDVLFSFKSIYSTRIYQLVKKWSKIGKYKIELEELKDLIGVPVLRVKGGVKEFKLGQYNNFKQRALEVALKEINDHSELELSITEHKTGRKITAITFHIKNKSKNGQVKEVKKELPEPSKEESSKYGQSFLEKYEICNITNKFINKQTKEEVYFDDRERVVAILTEYTFTEIDKESLLKMEDTLTEIIQYEDFNIVREMYFLFNYTKHASSIEKPSAFITSVLTKIKNELLKGNIHVKVLDFINVRTNNIDMNIPQWKFEYLTSKREIKTKEEIQTELDELEGTNLNYSDVRFLDLMRSFNNEETIKKYKEENLEKYEEYNILKESGTLEESLRKREEKYKETNLWNNNLKSLKQDAAEILYEERKKKLITT